MVAFFLRRLHRTICSIVCIATLKYRLNQIIRYVILRCWGLFVFAYDALGCIIINIRLNELPVFTKLNSQNKIYKCSCKNKLIKKKTTTNKNSATKIQRPFFNCKISAKILCYFSLLDLYFHNRSRTQIFCPGKNLITYVRYAAFSN